MEYKITESEWQLMELVWQGIGTQPRMMEQLGKKWNKNTVHTFLTRLCAKGYLEVDKEASPHRYRALVCREECERQEFRRVLFRSRQERQNFLQRVYRGSVGSMVASFVKDNQLSEKEIGELRKLLDNVEKHS